MENLSTKTPHVIEQIFNHLDLETLNSFKGASKGFFNIIEESKSYWLKIVEANFGKVWRKHLEKCEIGHLMEFAISCLQFHDFETPLHLAAFEGHLEVYKKIAEDQKDKNPVAKNDLMTPLQLAAFQGHFSICQFIVQEDGFLYDFDIYERCALHYAVISGHFEIVKLLVEKVNVKIKNLAKKKFFENLQLEEQSIISEALELAKKSENRKIMVFLTKQNCQIKV